MGLVGDIAGAIGTGYDIFAGERNRLDAKKMFDRQVELDNTAVQRRVKDLEAAGLSPVLAASGSGASTPTSNVPQPRQHAGNIMQAAMLHEQIKNMRAQNELLKAQTQQVQSSTDIAQAENSRAMDLHPLNRSYRAGELTTQINDIARGQMANNITEKYGMSTAAADNAIKTFEAALTKRHPDWLKSGYSPDVYNDIDKVIQSLSNTTAPQYHGIYKLIGTLFKTLLGRL